MICKWCDQEWVEADGHSCPVLAACRVSGKGNDLGHLAVLKEEFLRTGTVALNMPTAWSPPRK